jgi:signal transduction histidine kinase
MPVPEVLRRRSAQDLLVGLVFTVSVVAITFKLDPGQPGRDLDVVGVACMLAAGTALVFRRRWPLPVLATVLAATVIYMVRDYPGGPFYLGVFVAVGTVASELDTRRALPPVAASMAVLALAGLLVDTADDPGWAHLLYLTWSIVAFLIGKAIRDRRELLGSLRDRNRQLEETREEEALRRVAEERVRIARDLHDIVAHNIAAISLQAASAAYVADIRPDQAREALLTIRQASRQTLDELRSTLDVLRAGDEAAPLAPTPGLADLPDLLDSVTRSGVPVRIEQRGVRPEVPGAVDCAAYRIVQESLTNVMRHAGTATATVIVDHRSDALDLLVEDDGRGSTPAGRGDPGGSNGTGHGIAGMRERASALGGTVEAGPRQGGGYRVRAHLPFEAAP